jgi:hypothetical protein
MWFIEDRGGCVVENANKNRVANQNDNEIGL